MNWRPTTTQSGHGHGASPDLLGSDFAAGSPNRKWLCDITYIPTDEGFPWLAGVMDAWSRSIVGWRMSDSLHASVTLDALRMEVVRRNPPRGLVHGRRFRTHEEARLAVFERIEVWHQRTRIHGSLGYVSPDALEATARAG